jgi:hypothetical protein
MKGLIASIMVMIVLSGATCAKLPQVGDRVSISTIDRMYYNGTITDFGNGFICLKIQQFSDLNKGPRPDISWDVCIWTGTIRYVVYIDGRDIVIDPSKAKKSQEGPGPGL